MQVSWGDIRINVQKRKPSQGYMHNCISNSKAFTKSHNVHSTVVTERWQYSSEVTPLPSMYMAEYHKQHGNMGKRISKNEV